FGFANYILPLQIGAPDVAFPRLNAFSYWLFLFGALTVAFGFLTPGGAADFGWTSYMPLADEIHSPGIGGNLWFLGLSGMGLGTDSLPLQIGAPGVAYPRLNAFSYWLFHYGALPVAFGFITPGRAADFGWTSYMPLAAEIHSPGIGGNLWFLGLIVMGLGTILGGVNMITTVVCMRAPGMTMFRMPIFTWKIFISMILVLTIFLLLAAPLLGA